MKKILVVGILSTLLALTACSEVDEAMQKQAEETKSLSAEAQRQAGMPRLTNFTELKLLNKLFELRDTEGLQTYTYVRDFNGKLHHICNSIGYGMPFSAQRTASEQPVVLNPGNITGGKGVYTVPQAEPNGLYPPAGSSATWVICSTEKMGFAPFYEEDKLSVSPFPLRAVDSYTLDEPPSWR